MTDLELLLREGLGEAAQAVPISADPMASYEQRPGRRPSKRAGRRRPLAMGLSLAGVAAAVALVVVTAIALSSGNGKTAPAARLSTQATVTLAPDHPLSRIALDESARILRARINTLHISGATLTAGRQTISVTVPRAAVGTVTALATTRGVFRIRQAVSLLPAQPTGHPIHQSARLATSATLTTAFERRFSRWNCGRPPTPSPTLGRDQATDYIIGCEPSAKYLLAPAAVEGSDIATAVPLKSPQGQWLVKITFNRSAASAWQQVTAQAYAVNNGVPQSTACRAPIGCNAVAMMLDGAVRSAPYISQPGGISTNQTEISGSFTKNSANRLAAVLANQPLPTSFRVGG